MLREEPNRRYREIAEAVGCSEELVRSLKCRMGLTTKPGVEDKAVRLSHVNMTWLRAEALANNVDVAALANAIITDARMEEQKG